MKKITMIAIAFAAVSFASCKKDRTCTCTTSDSTGTYTDATTYYDVKKADARRNCIGYQSTYTSPAGTSVGDKVTCELK